MKNQNNQIDKSWVDWAARQVGFLKDGGYLIFPSDGAIFQINKQQKTITLVCSKPSFIHSTLESTNQKVFAGINYRYVKADNVPTSPDAIIDEIFGNLQKYSSDIPTLLHGIGVIFKLKDEAEDDKVLLDLIEKKGKKLPINPVTIRGEGNFTAGRLWVEAAGLPDASYRFNPAVKRGPRWEKPVTILLWKEGQSLSVDDPNRPAMIVDEVDFIEFVKTLQNSQTANVTLWGQADRSNEHNKMLASFEKCRNEPMKVELYKYDNDCQERFLVGEAILDFDKFIDGLGHLFPNGELS